MYLRITRARHGKRGETYFYRFETGCTLTAEEIEELREQFLEFKDSQALCAFKFAGLQIAPDNKAFEIHPVAPASLVDEIGSVAFFRALVQWLGCEQVAAYELEPAETVEKITDGFALERQPTRLSD